MSKQITSPIKEYAGYVVIPHRFTMPQLLAWEKATKEQSKLFKTILDTAQESDATTSDIDNLTLPVICELVEEWHIEGQPDKPSPDTLLLSPRKAGHEFIAWLGGELRKVYTGEIDIPNE